MPTVSKRSSCGGELELGADPVGARHEDRVLVALGRLEQPREAADRREDLGPQGRARDLADLVDEALVVVEVDPGGRVGGRAARAGVVGAAHAAMDRRAGLGAQSAPCYRRSVKLSVVIPALDEAERIETAIRGAFDAPLDLARRRPREPTRVEVIVVDGGSSDATRELAAAAGARVLACERGRARQLAAGVRASAGDVVLLLHADTRLPRGWRAAVCDALRDDRVVGGAFRFRFDERSPVFRFIEFGARLRSGLWRLPYGDQALFVRRRTLEAIGGIPEVPVMEDLDLVQRHEARGTPRAARRARGHLDAPVPRGRAAAHDAAPLARGGGLDARRRSPAHRAVGGPVSAAPAPAPADPAARGRRCAGSRATCGTTAATTRCGWW